MAKDPKRKFGISDMRMLITAQVFHGNFVADEPLFFGFNGVLFEPNFKLNFLADIDIAREMITDIEVVADIIKETVDFKLKRKECEAVIKDLKYFVRKAYPDNTGEWLAFEFRKYEKARHSQDGMIKFIEVLSDSAKKYKAELIAAGYTQAKVNALKTLSNQLLKEEKEQESEKSKRPVTTRQRIAVMNNVWNYMVEINRASKVIFSNDFIKLKQYELPPDSPKDAQVKRIYGITEQNPLLQIEVGVRGAINKAIRIKPGDGTFKAVLMDGATTPFFNFIYPATGNYLFEIIGSIDYITELHMNNSSLTEFHISQSMKKLHILILQNNKLKSKAVDRVLIDANRLGLSDMIINLIGNEAPGEDGLIAKAELEARGCTVLVS